MTIRFYIFVLLVIFACGVTAQTIPQTVDELLKVYSQQRSFNGVALVASNGSILLQKGYGLQDAKKGSANTINTIFQVGSLTKQFTAAIILQLQEENKLSVQDKLSKYIPGYPQGDRITLGNLLSHTSGVFNYTKDDLFMRTSGDRHIVLDSLIARFMNKPLDFQPGTAFGYSNSGYILLGAVIERVTGRSYFQVVRSRILLPLKMDHSGFDFRSLKNADKAIGYLKLGAKFSEPAATIDSSVSYAAGGFYTTAADLYKWDRSLYGHKILSDTSLKQAFTPQQSKYGYGWYIDSSYGKKVMMSGGEISGFSSFIAHIPSGEACIILLDNTGAPSLAGIAENINAILDDQPFDFPQPREEIVLDSTTLVQYTGDYRFSPDFIITITLENGELIAQATGQGKNEIFPEKENLFFLKLVGTRMEFIKGPAGRVEKMIFYQEGLQTSGLKIR